MSDSFAVPQLEGLSGTQTSGAPAVPGMSGGSAAAARALGLPSTAAGPGADGLSMEDLGEGGGGEVPNLAALLGLDDKEGQKAQQDEVAELMMEIEAMLIMLEEQLAKGDRAGAEGTWNQLNGLQNRFNNLPGGGANDPISFVPPAGSGLPMPSGGGGGGSPVGGGGGAASSGGSGGGAPAVDDGTGPQLDTNNDTSYVKTVERQGKLIGANIAPAFDKMVKAAQADGVDLRISSGFRSRTEQERLWNQYGRDPARVARPGTSNHEKGNAIDFSNTPGAYSWLKQNAAKYGMKNYPPEPWHYSTTGR